MVDVIINVIDMLFAVAVLAAALLMVPQIIKIIRVKNSEDFSLISYAGFNVFQLGMVFHGIVRHDVALTVGMSLAFLLNLITVILIVVYRR